MTEEDFLEALDHLSMAQGIMYCLLWIQVMYYFYERDG